MLKSINIAFVFLFMSTLGFCQKSFVQASKFFNKGDFDQALEYYSQIDTSQLEVNDNFKIGACYYHSSKEKTKGIPFLNKYINHSDSVIAVAYFYLGSLYHKNYQFDESINTLTLFLEKLEYEKINKTIDDEIYLQFKNEAEKLISNNNYGKIMEKSPRKVLLENLGDSINTKYQEYTPVISLDEKQLIFTSRRPGTFDNKISDDGDYYEDIYSSILLKGSLFETDLKKNQGSGFFNLVTDFEYTKATPLPSLINTKTHDASIQLSNDGKKLYFYRNFDVWITQLINDSSWTEPELFSSVNTHSYEPSVYITLDEQTMFITSEKEGGYGGLDIYVSEKDSNGIWTEMKNLGPTINTDADEDISYVSPEKNIIYFASKGHSSMGGYDVFKSIKNNGEWGTPINMGSPLNSPYDDVFFVMTPKYNRGYFASDRPGGKGQMDLYRLTFADERNPLAELAGLVLKGDSLVPAKSKIEMRELESDIKSVQKSKELTGEYLLLVEHGKKYEMYVETEGFAPYKKTFLIPEQLEYYQLYQEIHHVYLKDSEGNIIGQQIITHNAFEDVNKSIRNDTLKQFYSKEDYSVFVRDTTNKSVQKFVDVKFYITEDSLMKLLKKDPNLKFIFPDYAEISFLYKSDEQFRYALNSYFQGKEIDINYLKEKAILINEIDEDSLSTKISSLKSPFEKPIIILFEYNQSKLLDGSFKELDLLYSFMKQYPQVKFKIKGYTDSKGSNSYNLKLSNERARQVYDYLLKKGVESNRLKYDGYGAQYPIAPNINIDKSDNPEGRALNRRVEFEMFD